MAGLDNVSSDRLPGIAKLAAVSWVIVTGLIWISSLVSLIFFIKANYIRETIIIVFLLFSFLLWRRIVALWTFRHASIGVALGMDTDRKFLKNIAKIDKKINKLQLKKRWLESYISKEEEEEEVEVKVEDIKQEEIKVEKEEEKVEETKNASKQ